MSDTLILEIDEIPAGLNKLTRMHWSARMKLLHRWDWLIIAAKGRKRWAPSEKAKVTIERHSAGTLDHDNFIGGLKLVIDALRLRYSTSGNLIGGNNIIKDDDAAHVEHGEHKQVRCKRGEQKTIIKIERITREETEDG
ncbi:hypothetical protein LCGC14_0728170 [marine sediment metagenome]|uniref:Uncharacterized protein n=1 Tax=marine sediment metagenome TaxID=412755 RepID=A0A0F9QEI4_9ZZZZ